MQDAVELTPRIEALESSMDKITKAIELQKTAADPAFKFTPSRGFNEPDLEGFSEGKFSLAALKPSRADLPLLAAGFGAGSAVGIGSYLQKQIPATWVWKMKDAAGVEVTVLGPAEISQLILGWLIYKFGGKAHQLVAAVGGGMIIATIGGVFKAAGWIITPGSVTFPSGVNPAPITQAPLPQMMPTYNAASGVR